MKNSFKYLLRIFIMCLTIISLSLATKAQGNKKVFLTDLFIAAIESEKDTTFINLEIDISNLSATSADKITLLGLETNSTGEYLAIGEYLKLRFPTKVQTENDQFVIQHKIAFENCTASDAFELKKIVFKGELNLINCDFSKVTISSSSFNKLESFGNRYKEVDIYDSQFLGNLSFYNDNVTNHFKAESNELNGKLYFEVESSGGDFFFTKNTFLENDDIELFAISHDSLLYGRSWIIRDRVDFYVTGNPVFLVFSDNKSEKREYSEVYQFLGNFKSIDFANNDLSGFLRLSTTADFYALTENSFTYFDISTSSFSETQNVIDWEQFDGNKLIVGNLIDFVNADASGFENLDFLKVGLIDSSAMTTYGEFQSNYFTELYLGKNDQEISNKFNYKLLLRSYYRLYSVFKAEGDIISANACYAEMKDLETRRLRYNYNQDSGFDNFFRWKLNSLLKAYTDYGTNPAKAVRMSFYIIIIFGLLYFFFPSEWDKESKKELLVDFKRFVKKNDHGYVKPFIKLSLGVFLSLVNGIMLSLNAFVTLGFGKIPTIGFPRYVCIIQGFIGWFLLSLFTVSLINQVLF